MCDAVETLFARVSAATSHWSPKDHPFDKVTAVTVKNLSQALVGQGRTAASTSLQTALSRTVTSLDQLDAAMDRAQRRADVLAAITGLRASYGTLKSVCSSDGSTPAGRSVGGSTPSTKAPTSPRRHQSLKPRGATCRKVQAIMVSMGQASAGWSPRSRPFDPRAAATFRALGIQLATLRGAPDPAPIQSAIHDNAQAFIGLADAMGSQDRKAVDTALASAQRAYSTIEQRCTLSVATPKGR